MQFELATALLSFQTSAKLFNDSVHGSIEVNSLERAIIDTLEFSRLKDIKQLGNAGGQDFL